MSRIENEKRVVEQMVELYCKHKLGMQAIDDEHKALIAYAHKRLDGCKFGDDKPACKRCPIHCYKPTMRAEMRAIMRWAGPRMIIYNPIAAIKHLLNK
ncbi:MAG: nitrous oxide-stimulated promoter family protein [Alistipes sp.]|nr:nitrous oxide-stimulated promoter family protein [Alistipes sp.]